MEIETAFALIIYSFVSSITPGPNNLMLMASGANYGVKRTIPHMLGIGVGFTFMIVIVGIGIIGLFNLWPTSYTVLKGLSIAYMLWLAWKIATAAAPDSKQVGSKPFTFLEAALFQWVNPKAWAMALTAISVYAPKQDLLSVLSLACLFGIVNLPSVSAWVFLGKGMRYWLKAPNHLRLFNWGMAALLVASLVIML